MRGGPRANAPWTRFAPCEVTLSEGFLDPPSLQGVLYFSVEAAFGGFSVPFGLCKEESGIL